MVLLFADHYTSPSSSPPPHTLFQWNSASGGGGALIGLVQFLEKLGDCLIVVDLLLPQAPRWELCPTSFAFSATDGCGHTFSHFGSQVPRITFTPNIGTTDIWKGPPLVLKKLRHFVPQFYSLKIHILTFRSHYQMSIYPKCLTLCNFYSFKYLASSHCVNVKRCFVLRRSARLSPENARSYTFDSAKKTLSLAASLWILSCQLSLLTSSSWKAQPASPFQITYLTFPVNPLAGYLSYRSQASHSFHLPISVIETKLLYSQLLRHTSYSFPLCPVFRRLLRSWLILHIHNSLSTHPIFRISSHSSPTLFLKALVLGEFILADSLNIWLSYIPQDWSQLSVWQTFEYLILPILFPSKSLGHPYYFSPPGKWLFLWAPTLNRHVQVQWQQCNDSLRQSDCSLLFMFSNHYCLSPDSLEPSVRLCHSW